jgi:hypothetical protein
MKQTLISHTDIKDISIVANFEQKANHLYLSFSVKGDIKNYIFPSPSTVKRADELWKGTCFELFLAHANTKEYYEFNISPSLAWNFYSLKDYRSLPHEVQLRTEPTIQTYKEKNIYTIEYKLEEFYFESFESYNLTAILLSQTKERTFWSSKQMKGTPDFHNRDYFLLNENH